MDTSKHRNTVECNLLTKCKKCSAAMKMSLAWDIADIAQCILAFINIPVCIIIGGVAYKALKDYTAQRKAGKDPEYIAADCGVKQETDFWK